MHTAVLNRATSLHGIPHCMQPNPASPVQDSTHNSMFNATLDHSVNMTLQPWKHKAPAKCVTATRVDVFPISTQAAAMAPLQLVSHSNSCRHTQDATSLPCVIPGPCRVYIMRNPVDSCTAMVCIIQLNTARSLLYTTCNASTPPDPAACRAAVLVSKDCTNQELHLNHNNRKSTGRRQQRCSSVACSSVACSIAACWQPWLDMHERLKPCHRGAFNL